MVGWIRDVYCMTTYSPFSDSQFYGLMHLQLHDFSDFYDLKELHTDKHVRFVKNTDGDSFIISDDHIFQFEKNSKYFKYKDSYEDIWKLVKFKLQM